MHNQVSLLNCNCKKETDILNIFRALNQIGRNWKRFAKLQTAQERYGLDIYICLSLLLYCLIFDLYCFQITRADFERYSRDSEIFKALDKNKDGCVTARELTSKAEMAFKVDICILCWTSEPSIFRLLIKIMMVS